MTASIDRRMVSVSLKDGHFPCIHPLRIACVPQHEVTNARGLTTVLEMIGSNPCQIHVTPASRHGYFAVWWRKRQNGEDLAGYNQED